MDCDQPFRIVLLVGTLMVFPIMAYHRLKSQATGEKLDRWQEGRFILFTLRPLGVTAVLEFSFPRFLARHASRVIRQNLIVSLGVSALLVLASVFGWVRIGEAVVIHEGSTLLVVANALRLLGYQGE